MKKNEHIPFYFITGTNRLAPREIRAVLEYADADIAGQKNGIIIWRLRRKPSAADNAGTETGQDKNGLDKDGQD